MATGLLEVLSIDWKRMTKEDVKADSLRIARDNPNEQDPGVKLKAIADGISWAV